MKAHYDQEMDLAIHLFQRVLDVDPEHQLAAENLKRDKDLLRRACRIDPTPPVCRTISNARLDIDRNAIAPG
jgi:hypothetical protein